CHGPAGQGDGEMASRLEKPPANYTDPEFRRTRIPAEMFSVITDGRLDAGMPPFGPANQTNPINETSRWDLVAAVYSLATPPEAIQQGETLYNENCAACHGETGQGDGPEAAAQETPPTDLTDLTYWYTRSNEDVFNAIANNGIPAHAYELTDDERWAVVDYGRTFSYRYVELGAPPEPIAQASISGVVTNATSGETVTEGDVVLRAFDATFQPMMSMTNTIGTDGSYSFDLTDVQPDWVFLVSTDYNNIGFSSDAARLERANPELTLPVTVFNTTTDPNVVTIDQMHILLNFANDQLQVDEFYVFSNGATSVFVGESGDPEAGTLQISLPEGAENVSFQRALGSMDQTIPANEMIQTADGWADTFPLNPGPSGLNLIVSYDLPYDGGATLSRPIHYQVTNANVIMQDAGVSAAGEGFEDLGVQNMGGNNFATYNRDNIAPGTTLDLTLDGRPQVTTASGSTVQAGNNNMDLIIGGISLLVVAGLAVFTVRTWRSRSEYEDDEEADEDDVDEEREQLLQAIVDLDESFEQGQIKESDYAARRAELKAALAEIWE
ncbi:MAG: c-type cytochrome, partial [Anaerolineales bacterium]|nr:c-type cytochrome [Anaerolineales bacterium]